MKHSTEKRLTFKSTYSPIRIKYRNSIYIIVGRYSIIRQFVKHLFTLKKSIGKMYFLWRAILFNNNSHDYSLSLHTLVQLV